MVRWNLTEMVVVEMTSKKSLLPLFGRRDFFLYMDDITYDKPFKTYEELISIMESRHIEIADKAFATQALENYSYYR